MYGNADQLILELLRSPTSLVAGMQALIDLCEKIQPSPIWTPFRVLEFERDYRQLTTWVVNLLTAEPPPSNITGFWFGLFNPYLPDGKPTSRLYLSGSTRFDLHREVVDWHCGPEYWPNGRYSNSAVLTHIYRAGEEAGVGAQAEFALCQGYACLVIADWCRGTLRGTLLGNAEFRAVTAGFDSGDIMMIDVLKRDQILPKTGKISNA